MDTNQTRTIPRKALPIGFLIALIGLIIAVPVLAAYYSNIDITESNGTDYDMLPVIVTMAVDDLADHGFIRSDGLDVRVKNSLDLDVPFMLADDRLVVASEIQGDTVNRLEFTTGNDVLDSFSVVLGDGGYVTITDNTNLEMAENFELEFDTWLSTSTVQDLLTKTGSCLIATDGVGALSATIYNRDDIDQTSAITAQPLYTGSYTIGAERVNSVPRGYIDKVSMRLGKFGSPTGSVYIRLRKVEGAGDIGTLLGTFGSIACSSITSEAFYDFEADVYNDATQDVRVTAEYSDDGNASNYVAVRYSSSDLVASAVFSRWNGTWEDLGAYDLAVKVYFADTVLTATHSDAEYTVTIANDGSDITLYLNGIEKDTVGTVPVLNTASDYVLEMDYMNYCSLTTGGTLRLTYEPDDIISGTTLINEEAPGTYDGTITWGANPAGITVNTSRLQVVESYYWEGIDTDGGGDIFTPEPARLTGGVDLVKLEKNPLNPLVEGMAAMSNGQLKEEIIWLGGAVVILAAAVIGTFLLSKEHIAYAAAVGLGITIMFYVMGIFEYWVIIIFAVALVASIIWERVTTF